MRLRLCTCCSEKNLVCANWNISSKKPNMVFLHLYNGYPYLHEYIDIIDGKIMTTFLHYKYMGTII